jgi:hypothetical protein
MQTTTEALTAIASLTERERQQADRLGHGRIWDLDTMAERAPEEALKLVARAKEALTPESVEVGMGATVSLWSDAYAYTIIEVKRNGKQIVMQRDKATRINREKDTFEPGGFFGHTENPDGQKWEYEPNPHGNTAVANWSEKRKRFYVSGPQGNPVSSGRHEHYDYNF